MDPKITNELAQAVKRLRDDMTQTLIDLVRIPSVVGSEGEAQSFIRRLYGELGLTLHVVQADKNVLRDHPAYVESNLPFEGRPNIIGVLNGDPRKKSIILNGHIDVVSAEPVDQWHHDPWGAEIEGNRLFGRGAMDMKAGLVTNLFAVKALASLGIDPGGTVMLQSVIEEEAGGGGGTLACLAAGYTADGMIITEPQLVPVISHAGVLYFRVKVNGKTAHAGRAHLGVNAIGKMMKIYHALEQLDLQRAAAVKFPLYDKVEGRSCHLNIGTLRCGDWPSTVAGCAEMECRISFVPGESIAEIQKTVEDVVRNAARRDDWLRRHSPEVEWFGWQSEPWYQNPDDVFVQEVLAALEAVGGKKLEVCGSTAGMDTRFSSYFGFPAISFGPNGDREHGFDEYVDLDSLPLATEILARATLNWCSQQKDPP